MRGQRYGRLTVVEYVDTVNRRARWRCRCDCGNEVVKYGNHLRMGHTRSCGCLADEYRKDHPEAIRLARVANTTHGGTHDRLFKIWTSMRNRCSNPRNPAYKWYGAKGVQVCEEWSDYETFKAWAYANGYDDTAKIHVCSIDRIDVNGNYSPDNCRWTDIKTQAENKTSVTVYTYGGDSGTLGYFAKKYGFDPSTLRWRVVKLKWPIEKALTMEPWECNRKEVRSHGTGGV